MPQVHFLELGSAFPSSLSFAAGAAQAAYAESLLKKKKRQENIAKKRGEDLLQAPMTVNASHVAEPSVQLSPLKNPVVFSLKGYQRPVWTWLSSQD